MTSRQFTQLPTNIDADAEPDVIKLTYDILSISEIGLCVATDAVIADNAVTGNRHWLITNLTVRQAIAMSIDRQSLIDNAYEGLGRKGESLIPPATEFWHYDVPDAEEYHFDLDAAAALLNDPQGDGFTLRAGAVDGGMRGEGLDPAAADNQDAFADIDGDGIREVIDSTQVYDDVDLDGVTDATPHGNVALGTDATELNFGVWIIDTATESQTAADIYIPWLASVGIRVQKVVVSEGAMIDVSYAADYDLYMWGFGGDVDPDFLLSVLTTAQILGWQDAWYSNPAYDALYAAQQGLVTPTERQAAIREMQQIAYLDQPYIVYMYPLGYAAVRGDRFTGWGNWSVNPGLGLSGFGNAFLMLQLEAVAATGAPPGIDLLLVGGVGAAVVAVAAIALVLVARQRKKREEIMPPTPPVPPPRQPPQPPQP
jgi:peptide/nickel transport system substrate-binding protein